MRYSIARPQPNAGLPIPRNGLLMVATVDDVFSFPKKRPDSLQADAPVQLVEGVKWSTIYRTPSTHKTSRDTAGDIFQKLFGAKLSGKYPGDSEGADLFLCEHINQGFVVLDIPCVGTPKLYGRPGNPMILSADYQDDQNGAGHNLNFEKAFADDVPYLLYTYPAEFTQENQNIIYVLGNQNKTPIIFEKNQLLKINQ